MPQSDHSLLGVVLDSWDRNNTILIGLLRTLPKDALAVRATEDGPTVAQLFHHIHYVRLVFIEEDAPEFATAVPATEWSVENDAARLERVLKQSAAVVRKAVQAKIESGTGMDLHYDHPVLLLQHMIWHEGYHHGQIKLALKLAGQPVPDDIAGPVTWGVWMKKTVSS